MSSGSSSQKPAMRSGASRSPSGSCQGIGPSFLSSHSRPLAKKLASGPRASLSFLLWLTKRLPLTAKTKPSGTAAAHFS